MKFVRLSTAITAASLLLAGQAFAAGYYVDEQSALRLGDAFSGGAASASDASAAFYGPASLILVPDQIVANVAVLPVTSEFEGTSLTADATDGSLHAVNGDKAKTSTTDVLPTFYMAKKLDDSLVLGVYVNAPYATGSKFGKTSVARYQAADSEITGIDFGASIAARVNSVLTLGGGLVMQYLKAETGVAINTPALCLDAEAAGEAPAGICSGLGLGAAALGSSAQDGYFKMEGHNTALGYQLGALLEFSENSRLGINYRSKIEHSLTGTATATLPASAALLIESTTADGRVDITTPETANISYFHKFGDLALQADASWTNWSRFEEMRVQSRDQTVQMLTADAVQYNWEESYRLALGASYAISPALTVRGGFAFDKSPIKDEYTKADFAFDDYKALSLGLSYGITDTLTLDAGVQHTFKQERDVDNNELTTSASYLKGTVTTEVTTAALGLRWNY